MNWLWWAQVVCLCYRSNQMATVVLSGIAIMDLEANFPLPIAHVLQGEQEPDPQWTEDSATNLLHFIEQGFCPYPSLNSCNKQKFGGTEMSAWRQVWWQPHALQYSPGNTNHPRHTNRRPYQPSPHRWLSTAWHVPCFLIFSYVLSTMEAGQSSSKEWKPVRVRNRNLIKFSS